VIGRLRGILIEKIAPEILIECAGIGYEVTMPMTSIYALPNVEEEAVVYTHFVVREDAQLLYGFANKTERKLFRLVIKVNGVGPKLGLAILSSMSADQFVHCVNANDLTSIIKIPGVGKKTAERLLIEMRDRLKDWHCDNPDSALDGFTVTPQNQQQHVNDEKADAVNALISLGYKPTQAEKSVKAIFTADMKSETIIRLALKSM
tara:strand:- start:575 stop:1189 length:615 start_codon:yes stop_codon:yes gene_type:complete